MPIATVINDKGRASGVRNGIGAVWGSKGLKAVVVDDQPSRRPDVTDPTAYKDLLRGIQNKIRASGVIDSKTGAMAGPRSRWRRWASMGRCQHATTC